jgi:hypothetical protein
LDFFGILLGAHPILHISRIRVNSQISRTWSAENPRALHENPLHSPESVFGAQCLEKELWDNCSVRIFQEGIFPASEAIELCHMLSLSKNKKKMVYFIGLPSVRYTLYFVKHAVQPGRKVTTLSRQQFSRFQNTSYRTKDSDLKTNLEI